MNIADTIKQSHFSEAVIISLKVPVELKQKNERIFDSLEIKAYLASSAGC